MHGTISHEHPQEVTPDLSIHTDPEEIEEEEQAAAEKAVTKEAFQCEWTALVPEFTAAQPEIPDWSAAYRTPFRPLIIPAVKELQLSLQGTLKAIFQRIGIQFSGR
ncbi:hypothetical protein K5549_007315 [Capra hircus]|nr:hypothetical protein K5549_007315 [Capra hircus]